MDRWLSSDLRSQDRWRYWSARSLDRSGREAQGSLGESGDRRSFHGFLAADRLSRDYQLNAALPATPLPAFTASVRLGVGRAQELMALGDWRQAKSNGVIPLIRCRKREGKAGE